MNSMPRRAFLGCLGAASAAAAIPSKLFGAIPLRSPTSRDFTFLNSGWHLQQLEPDTYATDSILAAAAQPNGTWMPFQVPAQVHDVLFAAGRIPDPHVDRNAAECDWVAEKDWVMAKSFPTPQGDGPAILRLDGMDTGAAAYLNGVKIADFSNMNRRYDIDLRPWLTPAPGTNTLVFFFYSPVNYMAEIHDRYGIVQGIREFKYLRKSQSDFTSYMGARPRFIKLGIYHDIILDVPGEGWLEDAWIRTQLADNLRHADILVSPDIAGQVDFLRWTLQDPDGNTISAGTAEGAFSVPVPDPVLWWPRTHGTPHLYTLTLDCYSDDEQCDSREFLVGIRSVAPVLEDPDTGEERFAFRINGEMIFLRGACWAPVEGMTNVWPQDRVSRLLDLTAHAGMNAYRVWAEGIIPPKAFYDECDRRGLLVWQDFMFGSGMHPDHVPAYVDNCREEIADTIKRLRNHACLWMWCGGNENQHFGAAIGEDEYAIGTNLFEELMPAMCAELDPDRHFHTNSPFGGRYANWPLEGDWHDYSTLDFTPEASVPTFASEVGRVSAPSLTSMRRFLAADMLWPESHDPRIVAPGQPAWPEMWQYRSVDGSWDKVGALEAHCDPRNAEELIRVLGTAHGEYLRQRIERERRGTPDGAPDGKRRCWGNLVWRLNDSWPIIYWSVIDYYLEPKIAYYFLRRAYSPVIVSFERTSDRLFAWVVNDSPDPVAGELHVAHRTFAGDTVSEMRSEVVLMPGQSRRYLDLTDFGRIRLRSEFLEGTLQSEDAADVESTFLLIGERYLHLPEAHLSVGERDGVVEISTDVFARQVRLEMNDASGAVFEDNFFDLAPGAVIRSRIIERAGGRELRIQGLNTGAHHLEL